MFNSIYSLAPSRILQTFSPQIAAAEVNLLCPYRTSISQHRTSFCSSLHSYRERIGLTSSSICPSCEEKPHTSVQFSPTSPLSLSYSISLTEKNKLGGTSTSCVEIHFWPSFFSKCILLPGYQKLV